MDLTFKTDAGRFNYRVGAIIIHDGKLLIVKNKKASYYYSVGGRVKFNETTQEAVVREVMEETGIKMEVERSLFFHEQFFEEKDAGEHFHEIAVYYLMQDTEELQKIRCNSYTDRGAAEELVWIPVDQLDQYTILPKSVIQELKNLPHAMKHIVEIEMR